MDILKIKQEAGSLRSSLKDEDKLILNNLLDYVSYLEERLTHADSSRFKDTDN